MIICVIIISYSPVVHSLISGRLDTLLELDSTAYDFSHRIKEQAEINWLNNKNNLHAGFQFDIENEETENSTQIRQLFFTHKLADANYTLGRFNRSDTLGYYTLDGVVAKYRWQNWGADFHAGKPLQIEHYNTIDAHRIYGADINHHTRHNNTPLVQSLDSYLGWQKIQDNEQKNYIHWGLSTKGVLEAGQYKQIEMLFNGSYITENKYIESMDAIAEAYSKNYGLVRVGFISWQPKQDYLSFKEQFYAVYANGRQSILQGDFFRNDKWNQQYYIRGRRVWRTYGNNGYGVTIGFNHKAQSHKMFDWLAQWDSLILKDKYIHSLYFSVNKNVSARLRAYVNAAVQYQNKQAVENNTAFALETRAERMLNAGLFVDFNARYIYNDNMENEYRFGIRLSYRFDDSIRNRKW